jgi:hypothetical protein
MRKNGWTDEQETYLKQNSKKTDIELSLILGKTPFSICDRKTKLGLRKKQTPLTEQEVNFLKDNLNKRSNDELASSLNRTKGFISNYLCRMHLKRDKIITASPTPHPDPCSRICRTCHAKTNYNRHSWTVFFQDLLKERYGYKYTEDQKILLDFTRQE